MEVRLMAFSADVFPIFQLAQFQFLHQVLTLLKCKIKSSLICLMLRRKSDILMFLKIQKGLGLKVSKTKYVPATLRTQCMEKSSKRTHHSTQCAGSFTTEYSSGTPPQFDITTFVYKFWSCSFRTGGSAA